MRTTLPKRVIKDNSKQPSLLKQFGRNITKLAYEGRIAPLIGRYKELEKITQILLRRTKNNPILIGEHGVGKTTIVQGLAQRIAQGKVPEELANKQIVALDLAALIAGIKFRGQLEERFKKISSEIRASGNIILFIDDIHTLIDVGAKGQVGKRDKRQDDLSNSKVSEMDAIGIIKSAFVREEIQCIAATTSDEYRRNIEQDNDLQRYFQTIIVEPPSLNDVCYILRGLRHRYEERHKLLISTDSLRAAVELSDRYIKDRHLLDKALNVIDRACYLVRLKNYQDGKYKEIQKQLKIIKDEREITEMNDNEEVLPQLDPREAALQLVFDERRTVTAEYVAEIVSKMIGVPIQKLVY